MSVTPLRAIERAVPVALAGLEPAAQAEVGTCLAARGLPRPAAVTLDELAAAIDAGAIVGAWLDPEPATVAALATAARAAAAASRPLVVLARPTRPRAIEVVAALAYLRAHGAVLAPDPDAWLEALCLLWWHGLPTGPRAAVIAPDGSWLAVAAASQLPSGAITAA
ncbi:MAG TPA: hypothetical protein VM734_21760, partial [Kofleriaceae bacterium]|nr:hypothetical protein [Kofleriaceae bacterium]